jgi:hypothetical protein
MTESVSGWVQPGRWHVLTFHGIGVEQDRWVTSLVDEFARLMTKLATAAGFR